MSAKQKLINILSGWKNLIFENEEAEAMAKDRAVYCAGCDSAEYDLVAALVNDEIKEVRGLVCKECHCPLSAKLRSPEETCPKGLWPTK